MMASSGIYRIKKYGLYAYQIVRIDSETRIESKVGEPNTYGVVASTLVDLMLNEILPSRK